MFDSQAGIANALLVAVGVLERPMVWFIEATTAWIPVILSDVWKTTPFVAILLLAGLQNIDRSLYEAAEVDGAGAWWRLWHITIPLLKPTIFVALIFRTLDAFRVFDLLYALTGGGRGQRPSRSPSTRTRSSCSTFDSVRVGALGGGFIITSGSRSSTSAGWDSG